LVRDEKGQKMSKSKGNTVDPVALIEELGCDGFRFGLTSLITYGGQDIKLSADKLEQGKLFANKLWNASRFVLMNLASGPIAETLDESKLSLMDQWILGEYETVVQQANTHLEQFRFGELSSALLEFTWYNFCDWYVEASKATLREVDSPEAANTRRLLLTVLEGVLKLLHPIMPHITEALWQHLPQKEAVISISVASYPTVAATPHANAERQKQVTLLLDAIRSIRNIRQQYNVPPAKPVAVRLETTDAWEASTFAMGEPVLRHFIKLSEVTIQPPDEQANNAEQAGFNVVGQTRVVVPLTGLIDLEQEALRLRKKHATLLKEQQQLYGMLGNVGFLERAPEDVVEKNKARLSELNQQLKVLEEQLGALG
jgi:valyl-tRNA synthetase